MLVNGQQTIANSKQAAQRAAALLYAANEDACLLQRQDRNQINWLKFNEPSICCCCCCLFGLKRIEIVNLCSRCWWLKERCYMREKPTFGLVYCSSGHKEAPRLARLSLELDQLASIQFVDFDQLTPNLFVRRPARWA